MTVRLHKVPESEKLFIGSLLCLCNDGKYTEAHEAVNDVEADDFTDPAYKAFYRAFRKLLDAGDEFDAVLLARGVNGDVENAKYLLHEAGESVVTAERVHVAGHAKDIRIAASQRRAVCAAQDLLNDLGKGDDPAATVEKYQAKLGKVVVVKSTDPVPPANDTYKPFPTDALPPIVRDYIEAAAMAIGCDPAFVALPMLAALSRAIGSRRTIQLKRSWVEPCVIWSAIVGRSGTHKSPALLAATSFLDRKEAESNAKYKEAIANYDQEFALYQRDLAAWKRSKTNDQPPWAPEEPKCERFLTTDATVEALVDRLDGQFDGILLRRDELSGWLGSFDQYKGGGGSDVGHWLSFWSAGPCTTDRKSGNRPILYVPRAAVSVTGGIQPDVLRRSIGREHTEDGLLARLLLAMPEAKPPVWTDKTIDERVEDAMTATFNRLFSMSAAADPEGLAIPFPMKLSSPALKLWIEFFNRHSAEKADLDNDLTAHWSKLEAYCARFALIFECARWAVGVGAEADISTESITTAIRLTDWFGHEAKRVYGLFGESEGDREQRELIELIRRRGGRVTARDLQMGVRQYREAGAADTALAGLVRAGFGRWEVVPTGRRPRTDFVLFDTSTVSTSTLFTNSAETSNSVGVDNVDSAETLSEFEAKRDGLAGESDIPF